jgi:sphingomyelin phosphodiesterase acid-like 3
MFLYLISANAIALNNFLVISDLHIKYISSRKMDFAPKTQAIYNDLDFKTFKKLIKEINKNIENKNIENKNILKPEFIIILGDVQGHVRIFDDIEKNEARIFKALSRQFLHTPIFYIFGNNDSLQKNYGSFMFNNVSPYKIAMNSSGWKNGFLSTGNKCNRNKQPCIINQNLTGGYYSAYIAKKLRMVALNSVVFS